MKVLVFEFICGGGLAGHNLPSSLAAEGGLMLQAMLEDLNCLPDIEVTVLIDARLQFPIIDGVQLVPVTARSDYRQILNDYLIQSDVFLPVAPESGDTLCQFRELADSLGKAVLVSSPKAIALCGNKLATIEALAVQGIPTVETRALATDMPWPEVVIKPVDGVGCEGGAFIADPAVYRQTTQALDAGRWIVQPFVQGRAMSVSCLFRQGRGWLLSVNRQNVDCDQGRFKLTGCDVNVATAFDYTDLVSRVAAAIPGLWGYVGIDVIESQYGGYQVLEINPRLTTSYVGVRNATGINPIEQMLGMLQGAEPQCSGYKHRTVRVSIDSSMEA